MLVEELIEKLKVIDTENKTMKELQGITGGKRTTILRHLKKLGKSYKRKLKEFTKNEIQIIISHYPDSPKETILKKIRKVLGCYKNKSI